MKEEGNLVLLLKKEILWNNPLTEKRKLSPAKVPASTSRVDKGKTAVEKGPRVGKRDVP